MERREGGKRRKKIKLKRVMRRKTIPLLIRVSVHVTFGKYVPRKIEFLSHDLRAIGR